MTERAAETTPRPHHKDPKPDRVSRHAVTAASAAFAVAMQTGPEDGFAASRRPYHMIHGDMTKAGITQAAIRAAVPSCAPYRAMSLLLRDGCAWGSDMMKTNTGRSRKSGAGAGPGRGRKRGGAARATAGHLPPLRRARAGRSSMASAPPPLRLGGWLDAAGAVAGLVCDTQPFRGAAPHMRSRLKRDGSMYCMLDNDMAKYRVSVWVNPTDARRQDAARNATFKGRMHAAGVNRPRNAPARQDAARNAQARNNREPRHGGCLQTLSIPRARSSTDGHGQHDGLSGVTS